MKPCMVSSCAFGRVGERREGQLRSSSTIGNRVSTPGCVSGLRAAGRRARESAPASPANDARPRLAMRHPRSGCADVLARTIHRRDRRARPSAVPRGTVWRLEGNMIHSSGRGGFRKMRARARSRAAAGNPSPVRRSLTCEAKVGFGRVRTASRVRQCRTRVDRTAVSARSACWFCTCQKESSNQIRRSDAEISRLEDRTFPNRLPIRKK